MAEDGGEQPFGIGAGERELVGVANAGRLDLDQYLAGFRPVELDLRDLQRLGLLKCDSGAGFHRGFPPRRCGWHELMGKTLAANSGAGGVARARPCRLPLIFAHDGGRALLWVVPLNGKFLSKKTCQYRKALQKNGIEPSRKSVAAQKAAFESSERPPHENVTSCTAQQ